MGGGKRDILLCDLDAFFASVEQRDHPELRGKPVIVGGDASRRGVVAACSYEARAYGVRSAMPMRQALELCPRAVVLPVRMSRYRETSDQVFSIFDRFTPDVEAVSIDEAYLAVSAGQGVETAEQIRDLVRRELELPLSVGVSCNKLLAKVACRLAKPDGLRALWPDQVAGVLWPLPVGILPGVGPKAEERLVRAGIRTVGDVAAASSRLMESLLGSFGHTVYQYAHGRDDRPLATDHQARSLSEEMTFATDVGDPQQVLSALMEMAEELGHRLRAAGLKARTIGIKLRFPDFRTITRATTLRQATESDSTIYRVASELFLRHRGQPPWRLVGVSVSGLEQWQQMCFPGFAGASSQDSVDRTLDALRERFGKPVVFRARRLPPAAAAPEPGLRSPRGPSAK
ncbi:MAG: DNA polymerase IV [Bacillota bacterium]|nr:DNA polymerase IV [Bacillota bacterium]MDI7248712.1 DNA polymerase IV [Bacillota bacterium]